MSKLIPKIEHRTALFFLLFLLPVLLLADSPRRIIQRGNHAFKKGKLEKALQSYTHAEALMPDSPLLAYNEADVFYRQKDYDKAIKGFTKATTASDSRVSQAAYYNLGNSHFQKKDYTKAIEAYKEALKLNPDDRDAKANLELARRKLKEQSKMKKKQQPKQSQSKAGKKKEQKEEKGKQKEEKKQQQKKKQKGEQKKEKISKEEAKRILKALREREKKEQKKQKVQGMTGRGGGIDW